jgi:hypothetical protein
VVVEEEIMQISEYLFTHLYEAEEEAFTRELEWRRVARERAAEDAALSAGSGTPVARTRRSMTARLRGLLRPMSHPGGTM